MTTTTNVKIGEWLDAWAAARNGIAGAKDRATALWRRLTESERSKALAALYVP